MFYIRVSVSDNKNVSRDFSPDIVQMDQTERPDKIWHILFNLHEARQVKP